MSIENIQYIQKDINKYKYKKLSRESFDEVLNYHNLYSTLPWCLKEIFKWNTEKVEATRNISGEDKVVQEIKVKNRIEGVWLNKNKSIELCNKNKNVDLITALFDDFDYSNECLNVLDLLSNTGAAILYVPALEYKNIHNVLSGSNDFYINAIFGSYDERDSKNTTDQEYILPESYKCLAIIITRVKTDSLYLWLEYNELDRDKYLDEDQDEDEWMANDLLSFFENNLPLTDSTDIYTEVVSSNRVVINSKDFVDIEGFYINTNMNQNNSWHSKFPKNKLSDICINPANSPIGIMNFLKCVDPVEGGFDSEKWKSFVEKNNQEDDKDDKNFSALLNLMEEYDEAINYIPDSTVRSAEQICIIETYSDEFNPPYFRVVKLHEWHVGQFKSSSIDDGSLNLSLLFLNPEKIIDNYFYTFMESEIGILSQKKALLNSGDNSIAWQEIDVLLPDIEQQNIIASALDNVNNLQYEISLLKDQLVVNPEKSEEINKNLKDWLKRLDKLSLDEKILSWIKDGESDVLEFKETLSLDIKKQTKEKYIEHSSLKTISGFLNSKGGVLLIGVSDDGEYPGVLVEVEKFHKDNFDKFLLHFKSLIKRSIGEEFYPYIEYRLVDVNESKVLYVNCKKSEKPCYLDGKDFYVRTNPATDKLEGPKLVDYIQNHFS